MAKQLSNNILVVDVESTCWKDKKEADTKTSEIIEIGVAILNPYLEQITKYPSIYVTNTVSDVSDFCTDLTGITQDTLDNQGISFSNALNKLRTEFFSRDMYWASYGNYDRKMFDKQCRMRGLPYPFHDTHFNVKSMARLALGLDKEVGMDVALDKLNLDLEGRHHCGADDAYNIAQILRELLFLMRL